jgi:hypothetical protein
MTIDQLLAGYEKRFRDAFLEGVAEITSRAQIGAIISALERGDINAALDAMYIEESAFRAFERAMNDAFGDFGNANIQELGQPVDQFGARFVFRFNVRNPRAEEWLRENSSGLVTRTVEEQREVIRDALQQGLERGDNPRQTALDIVGRIDKNQGRRTGGIVGLSAPMEQWARNAQAELEAGEFADYKTRKMRDRRLDRLITKAEKEGRKLSSAEIYTMLTRYKDRLLKLRGDTIAKTESIASLSASRYEGLKQLLESGKIVEDQIRRYWDATNDARTRPDHLAVEAETAERGIGLNDVYIVGGVPMKHPHDPDGGAGQVINCRCTERIKIDWLRSAING